MVAQDYYVLTFFKDCLYPLTLVYIEYFALLIDNEWAQEIIAPVVVGSEGESYSVSNLPIKLGWAHRYKEDTKHSPCVVIERLSDGFMVGGELIRILQSLSNTLKEHAHISLK